MLALAETGAVLKISFTTMPHALGLNMGVGHIQPCGIFLQVNLHILMFGKQNNYLNFYHAYISSRMPTMSPLLTTNNNPAGTLPIPAFSHNFHVEVRRNEEGGGLVQLGKALAEFL